MSGQIVPILPEQAAPLLAEAFAADPAFDHFTQPAAPENRAALRAGLIGWIAKLHHQSGQPILGWQVGGQIIGCALVEDRSAPLRRALAFLRLLPRTLRLPGAVLRRLNQYARQSGQARPAGVTHFLVLLGLSDAARGQGHGARFLAALHLWSGQGAYWALDTENPANPPFYRRMGYQTYATEPLGAASMIKMHRPPVQTRHSDENQP